MLQGSAFLASSPAYPTKLLLPIPQTLLLPQPLSLSSDQVAAYNVIFILIFITCNPFSRSSFLFVKLSKGISLPIMGKEWYWAGRSAKRGGGGEAEAETQTQTQTPSGCMCAVFQFLDFHPFHFPTINNQQQQSTFKSASCIPEDHTTVPKGAEAPRNSLESEGGTISSLSKEEYFKIPKNIQIKTSGSTRTSGGNLNDLSSEISSSPGTKTPTLVARLMGLDLLPGAHSPSSSFSSCLSTPNPKGNAPNLHNLRPRQHIQTKPRNSTDSNIAATRSLPETPRISSARRSDVDHHRLSLQINKENMGLGEDLELPRLSFSKWKCDENNSRSPSLYARQIVKQVKESVSRKVGQDITNTLKSKVQAREEFVGQFRIKKSPKTSVKLALDESSPGKHSNHSSYSPRLRFIDTNKHKPSTTPSPLTPKDQNIHPAFLKLPSPPVNTQPQLPRVLTKPKPPQALPEQQELKNQKSVPKCKNVNNEKFSSRLKRPPQTSDIIRNKQEELFIIRPTSPTRANDIKTTKSKKTHPLSSNLLNNINTVPNLLPVKTDPSPPATKIPQKQSQVSDTQESKRSSQLSSGSRQRYKQEGTSTLATRESSNNEDKPNGASTTGAEDHRPEFRYITGILSRTTTTEVYKEACTTNTTTTTTTVSFNQWFSPTHPLDPSIFHHLEHHPTSTSYVSSPNKDKDCNFTQKNELGPRWNRRLLFDLVDEVLLEILRPKNSEKKLWFLHSCCCYQGTIEGLIERVWKRIGKFSCAKCEVLEDIDGLIEAEDMKKVKVEDAKGLEEEREGLVTEIEGNIWDTLVHETVTVMVTDCCGSGKVGSM